MLSVGQQDQANNILKEKSWLFFLYILYEKEDVDICFRMVDTNIDRLYIYFLPAWNKRKKYFYLELEHTSKLS
jgi:hypothetical protein